MAKSGVERVRAYRDRKSRGVKTVGDRVEELEWQVKAQALRLEALEAERAAYEARIVELETRATVPLVTPNNALAQLRAQIAAVPVRPQPLHVPNPPNMPIQPMGEWESA